METGSDDKPINPPGTDPRDITRVAPGLVEGVVVDLVKDRESRALKGTGRLSVAVHLLLLLTCLIMAGFTLSEVTFRVPSPIVGAAIRLRPSTWIMLSLAVLLDLLAGQWRRRHASKPRHVRCASTVSLLIFGYYMIGSQFSFFGYLLIELAPAYVFLAIGALAIAGSVDPKGEISLRCTKCKYQFTPGREAPDLCSECGAFWLGDRGLTRQRQFKRSTPILYSGIFALLLGVMALAAVPKLHSRVPTQWLLPKAHGTALGMSDDEWLRLDAANIDEKQRRQLAETLLLQRKRRSYMSREADQWYQSAIAASLLPSDLVESYFAGMLDASIEIPSMIQRGVPFRVSLKTNIRPASPFYSAGYVWFEGYQLDGELLANQTPGLADISDFGNITSRGFGRVEHGNSPPITTIEIPTAGEHKIHACYWIIGYARTHSVTSVGTDHISVTLDEAGRPIMDPKWHYLQRFEVSTTITVTGDD